MYQEDTMMSKLTNSWNLVKASARVLSADKELLIFPILSTIGTAIVSLTFFLPMWLTNAFETMFTDQFRIFTYVMMFLFYVVQYTVVFFANTALVGAALIRLKGGDPTVGDGIRIAGEKFGPILGYALIAATVGMLLRMVSERSKGLGRIMVSLVGLGWNLATFLVVPILAVENVGPIEAIKRSTALLKKTWGEQIAGNVGIGAVFGLIFAGILVLSIGAILVSALILESVWLSITLGVFMVILLTVTGLINSTLNGIYSAAVYQYAATGQSDGFFDRQLVENAFVRS